MTSPVSASTMTSMDEWVDESIPRTVGAIRGPFRQQREEGARGGDEYGKEGACTAPNSTKPLLRAPISTSLQSSVGLAQPSPCAKPGQLPARWRSEEHTSELQSRGHLVCRLLLEKKKANIRKRT